METQAFYRKHQGKWGPTLVDKRPNKFQRDGKTMLEKAQERKKINNLEKNKGIPKPLNPFSVMAVEEVVTSHP
jgi:hypothetical protein